MRLVGLHASALEILGLAACLVGALGGSAFADEPTGTPPSPTDYVPPPPPTFKGDKVTVEERLGARVPADLEFRDHAGKLVTLGDALRGDLPTILTFNYSDCPMLCNLQLSGLAAVLGKLAEATAIDDAAAARPDLVVAGKTASLRLGAQFRVLTVVLEPTQTVDRTQATRTSYLERLPKDARATAARGWTFLTASDPKDARAIAALADAVGFRYTYLPERAEWAHPAALIFLSTAGEVTRYVYGTEFEASVIRESIVKAGLSEPSTAIGFMNRCYHYDPDANNHSRAGVLALRVGAMAFLGLVILAFAGRRWLRRPPRDSGVIQA